MHIIEILWHQIILRVIFGFVAKTSENGGGIFASISTGPETTGLVSGLLACCIIVAVQQKGTLYLCSCFFFIIAGLFIVSCDGWVCRPELESNVGERNEKGYRDDEGEEQRRRGAFPRPVISLFSFSLSSSSSSSLLCLPPPPSPQGERALVLRAFEFFNTKGHMQI